MFQEMELSKNAQKILELIKEMTAVEMNQLVKAIEEEFGVSAAAMVVA
jgi:large subunit ribosomal protein L7/L12